MPRVMFTISYRIKPEVREKYLAIIREMRGHVETAGKKNYSVFESKGKQNQFTEVYVTETLQEYEALEDNQDERTEELIRDLGTCVDKDGMKYATLIEME